LSTAKAIQKGNEAKVDAAKKANNADEIAQYTKYVNAGKA
jgi:hypothetical protein